MGRALRNSLLAVLATFIIGGTYLLGTKNSYHETKKPITQTSQQQSSKPRGLVGVVKNVFEDERCLETIKKRYEFIGKDPTVALEKIKRMPYEAREAFPLLEELPEGFQYVGFSFKDKYEARTVLKNIHHNYDPNARFNVSEDVLKSVEWMLDLKYNQLDREIINRKCEKNPFWAGSQFYSRIIKFDGSVPLNYCLNELPYAGVSYLGMDMIEYMGKGKLIFIRGGFVEDTDHKEAFSRYEKRLDIKPFYKEIPYEKAPAVVPPSVN